MSCLPDLRRCPGFGTLAGMDAAPIDQQAPLQARTVLIADDHVLVRDGIKLLVSRILGPVTIFEAGDSAALMRMAQAHSNIDVALVDLNMPGMDRGAGLNELARRHPAVPVVVVSALTSPDVVRRTLNITTVYAFVPKSATSDRMRAAISAALQRIKLPFEPGAETPNGPEVLLTPRLEEVRLLLRRGMSNKLIASTLGISEGTVKNHMTEIFRALNVSNRTQAAQHDSDTS